MKRELLEELGVPEEKWKELRAEYWSDVNKAAKRLECKKNEGQLTSENEEWLTRSAIDAMLKLIKRPETLDRILQYINKAYYTEV